MNKARKFKYQTRRDVERKEKRENILLTLILSVGIVLSIVGLFLE
jgi:hypothetical protein